MSEAYGGDGSVKEQMTRGSQRIRDSLLKLSKSRPLTNEEIEQLSMIYGEKPPTKEFAEFILRNGMEE